MKPDQIAAERAAVVEEVERWIGTRFHHAARIKGVGVDCCQLVLAVYVGLGLIDEPAVEPYPAQWFLHQDRERILDVIARDFVRVDAAQSPDVGDVALFRFGRCVSHAGIVVDTDPPMLVHSFIGQGVTREAIGQHSAAAARFDSYWTLRRWTGDPGPREAA